MPRRRNQEMRDITEETVQDVGRVLCNKCLLIPGMLMSLCGFGSSSLDFLKVINFSYFNRYLHLGKNKWILQSGSLMLGFIGVIFVLCAFPSARAKVKSFCCRRREGNTGIPYAPLHDEEAAIA